MMKKLLLSSLFMAICGFTTQGIAQTTITLQPDGTTGKDTYLHSLDATTNFGSVSEFNAIAWTAGPDFVGRSMVEFDLSVLPAFAQINSATLFLYHNPTSSNTSAQHQSLSGPNSTVLRRITTAWDENTVTWNNQPTYTTTNEVLIPQTSGTTDNFTIDVTTLVEDMLNDPSNSHGFIFMLQDEVKYRSVVCASSDHSDPSRRPRLDINYTDVTGLEELTLADKELVMIVDFMGRQTTYSPNTPLIYVYSDGTRERIMSVE